MRLRGSRFSSWRGRRAEALVVLASFLVTNVIAALWLWQSPRLYEASKDVFVATSSFDTSTAYKTGYFSQTRVQSYAALAKRPEVLKQVIEQVDPRMSVRELAPRVTATVPPVTVVMRVSVEDTRRARAAKLATALAEAVAEQGTQLEAVGSNNTSPVRLVPLTGVEVSNEPVSPQLVSTLVLAELAAVVGALALLALIGEWRRRRIGSAEAAAQATALLSVTEVRKFKLEALLNSAPAVSDAMEDLRILRTQLTFSLAAHPGPSVLVVPVETGQEVGSLAIGLALAFRETTSSVLLIDGDLRTRALSRAMALESAPGLTEAVALDDAPHLAVSSTTPSFDVLACGRPVPSATDILASHAWREVVGGLQGRFGAVVVTAPASQDNADAALWSTELGGGALLVARKGRTPTRKLVSAAHDLERANVSILGVVVLDD